MGGAALVKLPARSHPLLNHLTRQNPLFHFGADPGGLERMFRENDEELRLRLITWTYITSPFIRYTSATEVAGCLLGQVVYLRHITSSLHRRYIATCEHPDDPTHQLSNGCINWNRVRQSLQRGYTPKMDLTELEAGFAGQAPPSETPEAYYALGQQLRKEFIGDDPPLFESL